jgi:hypothetical protein
MGIVMDMCSYRAECEAEEYGEEVLCSGWNPVVAMTPPHLIAATARPLAMPPNLAAVDTEAFLHKMYACQG